MPSVKQIHDALVVARSIISKPEAWIKYEFANDALGSPVEATDDNAACFCSIGALAKATGHYWVDINYRQPLLDAINTDQSVTDFNDDLSTTHEMVLAVFDKAIANQAALL